MNAARLEAFEKVLAEFHIDPKAMGSTGEEDAAEAIEQHQSGEVPLERFCLVTTAHSGGCQLFYAYAQDHDLVGAMNRAIESIDDSLFAETPVRIIDLDTGERKEPDWRTLQWKEEKL